VAASILANVLAAEPSLPARCISAWPAIAFVLVVEVITRGAPQHLAAAEHPAADVMNPSTADDVGTDKPIGPGQLLLAPPKPKTPPRKRTRYQSPRVRRPIEQTRELAANLRADNPQISQAEVARQLGISATRLRQVDHTEVDPEHVPSAQSP
jgi:hypothetical protein